MMICEYKRRREKSKKEDRKKFSRKIAGWKREIRRIEERNRIIEGIDENITKYFDLRLILSNKRGNNKTHLSFQNSGKAGGELGWYRRMFYRCALERGINGRHLIMYTKDESIYSPSRDRKRVIKNKEQNELYKRFLTYTQQE